MTGKRAAEDICLVDAKKCSALIKKLCKGKRWGDQPP